MELVSQNHNIRLVMNKTLALANQLLDDCISTIITPIATVIWNWIFNELSLPCHEVPILFASTNDISDNTEIFNILEKVGIQIKNQDEAIIRLNSTSCSNGSLMLYTILQNLHIDLSKQKSFKISVMTFCRFLCQKNQPIIILVDDTERFHSDLLLLLIDLCYLLRSEYRTKIALIFGMGISTVESLQQIWPSDRILKTISTGIQISKAKDILSLYIKKLETTLHLSTCLPFEEEFLDEQYQMRGSLHATRRYLDCYIKLVISSSKLPLFYLPICIYEKENDHPLPKIVYKQICLVIEKVKNPSSSYQRNCHQNEHYQKQIQVPSIKNSLTTIYKQILQKCWMTFKSLIMGTTLHLEKSNEKEFIVEHLVIRACYQFYQRIKHHPTDLSKETSIRLQNELLESIKNAQIFLEDINLTEVINSNTKFNTILNPVHKELEDSLFKLRSSLKSHVEALLNPKPIGAMEYLFKQICKNRNYCTRNLYPVSMNSTLVSLCRMYSTLCLQRKEINLVQWFYEFCHAMIVNVTTTRSSSSKNQNTLHTTCKETNTTTHEYCSCRACLQLQYCDGLESFVLLGVISEPKKRLKLVNQEDKKSNSEDSEKENVAIPSEPLIFEFSRSPEAFPFTNISCKKLHFSDWSH